MSSIELLLAVFGSAAGASAITALFSKAQTDKAAKIENIIKERKAWRDKLRSLVFEVTAHFEKKDAQGIQSAKTSLAVLLNPYDKKDGLIIESLSLIPDGWNTGQLQEFTDRIAFLLKHDWERVKQESTTRISYQTLGLASLVVGLLTTLSEVIFHWDNELSTLNNTAFWLAAVFFFIALIANPPKRLFSGKRPFSWLQIKKLLSWAQNEPFREPYIERSNR